ncbi:PLDc N-terminal domain-containing protein [Ktedonosporobacter rubrisoli]|nr:PLDc N-terminal domain-containing protein [Ktedonosporobacter rubrisoli]
MLLHCLLNRALSWKQKVLWLLVIGLCHILGALLYFCVVLVGGLGKKKPSLYSTPANEIFSMARQDPPSEEFPLTIYEQPQASYPEDKR